MLASSPPAPASATSSPSARKAPSWKFSEVEHHLEHGGVRQAPLRTHLLQHPLERELLVRVRVQRGLAHPPQQLAERRVARQVGPQRQRVEEEAHHPVGLRPRPPRDRRPDHDVLLPGKASEDHVQRGEEDHEQRGALAAGQRVHVRRQLRRRRPGARTRRGAIPPAAADGRSAAPGAPVRRPARAARTPPAAPAPRRTAARAATPRSPRTAARAPAAATLRRARRRRRARTAPPAAPPPTTRRRLAWCRLRRRWCSASATRTSDARKSGPRARSKRCREASAARRLGLGPPLVVRQVPQVGDRQVEVGRRRGDPLHGNAVHGRQRRAQRLVAAHQLGKRAAQRVVDPEDR